MSNVLVAISAVLCLLTTAVMALALRKVIEVQLILRGVVPPTVVTRELSIPVSVQRDQEWVIALLSGGCTLCLHAAPELAQAAAEVPVYVGFFGAPDLDVLGALGPLVQRLDEDEVASLANELDPSYTPAVAINSNGKVLFHVGDQALIALRSMHPSLEGEFT